VAGLRRGGGRRIGVIGVAFAAWDIWMRIPPDHRRRLVAQARAHGPRLAREALRTRGRR
jgi:hypothetical protein